MTITLTVEEIQAHEKLLRKWTSDRASHCAKWLHQNTSMSHTGFRDDLDRFESEIKKYDAANPIPKLLPAL